MSSPALVSPHPRCAQGTAAVAKLVAEPAKLTMQAGDSVPFKVTAYDAEGKVVPNAGVRVGGPLDRRPTR